MSINRVLTRWATVCALNNYMQEPWPTLAGPNVFDSKIEPVEDMATDRALPCCVVYTDYDQDPWSKGKKTHERRLLTVTIELLIVQATQEQGDPIPTYSLDCPSTDSEIESALDIFETQIFRALTKGTEATDAFNYLCPSYKNVISRRGASALGGQRLAARQIALEMESVRDNMAGVIPAELQPFITRLESFPDYAPRIDELKAVLTAPAAQSPNQRLMQTIGYTRDLMEKLGRPVTASGVLPPNIVYLNSTGGPLP